MAQIHVKLCALLVGAAGALGANSASAVTLPEDADTVCKGLVGGADAVKIDSATLLAPSQLAVAERGPTPSGRVTPANPGFCKVLGHIDPTDPEGAADPISSSICRVRMERPLGAIWRRRIQRRGDHRLGLPPASPFDAASPLARGFVDLRHRFRSRGQAGRAAADLCAQRRSLRELRPCVLQEGARCRRHADRARLWRDAGRRCTYMGQFGRRARGADHGAALP